MFLIAVRHEVNNLESHVVVQELELNEGSLYLDCNDKMHFTSEKPKRYKLWSYQKMCDALHYLLDNIFFIRIWLEII